MVDTEKQLEEVMEVVEQVVEEEDIMDREVMVDLLM